MTKTLLVSGTHSGCGKTSVTLGLLAWMRRAGLDARAFKTGPDFIDPGLHALACGRTSHNLDSWMLTPRANREIFARYAAGGDVALVEGAMGLFDGLSGTSELGSAAHMAKLLGIPALLVADASGMARSAAALAQGFARFDPELGLAGVVFNRVGGPGHREILAEAMERAGVPLLGCLPKAPDIALPSRHLGLVTAGDLGLDAGRAQGRTGSKPPDWLARLADWVETLDPAALLERLPSRVFETPASGAVRESPTPQVGRPGRASDAVPEPAPAQQAPSGRVRLGLARDRAFCFCYEENLRLLEMAGAEIVPFSPLEDAVLPPGLDGLYLPGGYPELHAAKLSGNGSMLASIRDFCASGRPVYAECGGFMLLMEAVEAVENGEGRSWPMCGVFACRAAMGERFAALGYREAVFQRDTPLGPAGTRARGHEFHFSRLAGQAPGPGTYTLSGRKGAIDGPEGFLSGNTLGSYVHLHFASNPELAPAFVAAMLAAKRMARA
ncbi:cobyrinate a,c-diamide synthase [Fundidesulfovibrio agrisoli]|uniref:cobyrinate a,c-diamide synthase n=1 Tax=Fundidesulfovibrio agrisoli TaxID=2922717 RepID=UPI001FABF2CB|nr:cobyrinate a,c-diamide synthase [Fundidesulfovibrio agrisoli]